MADRPEQRRGHPGSAGGVYLLFASAEEQSWTSRDSTGDLDETGGGNAGDSSGLADDAVRGFGTPGRAMPRLLAAFLLLFGLCDSSRQLPADFSSADSNSGSLISLAGVWAAGDQADWADARRRSSTAPTGQAGGRVARAKTLDLMRPSRRSAAFEAASAIWLEFRHRSRLMIAWSSKF
uniref:Uncharacterized protein n=1 Tax=Macrostomum lignano TaxID=282301 RepID=A0A1I8FE08_9PLAT